MSNCAQYDETCDCAACAHDRDRGHTSSGTRLPRPEHEPKIDGRTGQVTHCRCGKMLPCPHQQTAPELVNRMGNLYGLIAPPFNEDAERVRFCDWYRNRYGIPATNSWGGWSGITTPGAWSAWLARAKV